MLRIATRKSALALWQAEEVSRRLAVGGIASQLVKMSTRGDEIIDKPLAKIGGKGLFVKELQRGMLEGRADLAVHSMKDVPAMFPEGFHLSVVLERESPTDALVSSRFASIDELPAEAVIGTCSLRRKCQLLAMRPDLQVRNLRGNVNTRLAKLDAGEFDAIILATAGLKRLQFDHRIAMELPPSLMLPACGQGIIGIECKSGDEQTNRWLRPLHDIAAAIEVTAERTLNRLLGGSCSTPIAGFAELNQGKLQMRALVGTPDGSEILRSSGQIDIADSAGAAVTPDYEADALKLAASLGQQLAEHLLEQGAETIIAASTAA